MLSVNLVMHILCIFNPCVHMDNGWQSYPFRRTWANRLNNPCWQCSQWQVELPWSPGNLTSKHFVDLQVHTFLVMRRELILWYHNSSVHIYHGPKHNITGWNCSTHFMQHLYSANCKAALLLFNQTLLVTHKINEFNYICLWGRYT